MTDKKDVKVKSAAIINIGSDALYLKIAESKNNEIKIIENIEYPISLGSDTFTTKKISYQKVEDTCKILNGFKKIIKEYGIKNIRTTATTAVREAINSIYITEQIETKTNLEVKILDDSEEKTYIYKELIRQLEKNKKYKNSNVLMIYIGTGSLGIAIYSNGDIIFSQNIRIGSLKLAELLGELQNKTDRFYVVVEDYLSGYVHSLKTDLPDKKIDYFVSCGKEIEGIYELCGKKRDNHEDFNLISMEDFNKLFEKIKDKTPSQLIGMFSINEERAETILPLMGIYKMILEVIKTDNIYIIPANLTGSLLYEMLHEKESGKYEKAFEHNSIISALNLGRKYYFNEFHGILVEKYATEIFEETIPVHRMGDREKLLLQIASLLHDVGKFINNKNHATHSFNILRTSEILGLSHREILIVANIVKSHSTRSMYITDQDFKMLPVDDQIIVTKLLAILRLADALNRSHKNKFVELEVKYKDDDLKILVTTIEDTILEEWSFNSKSEFFEEVFGIKPVLKKVVK